MVEQSQQHKKIFISAQPINNPKEIRIAVTSRGKLLDLDIERQDLKHIQKKSNIYKGRISSIEPSLAAVFVDYGCERHGFLPLKEISQEYYLSTDPQVIKSKDMKKLLKLGQEVVIQVEKEERGNKGAALSTYISIAGSYLVLMPNSPRAGGISRRVEAAEREHLQALIKEINLPPHMGLIVRTAGVGRSKQELAWDLDILLSYWDAIKTAAVQKPGPYLIHQESGIVTREIRDHLRRDVSEVLIDNPDIYQQAREYVNLIKPDYLPRVKLYQDPTPLFLQHHIEQQIESAYQRELRLPSGGSIVFDQTEALVAVDINSARATKGSDIEETALHTNLEAADEIARQLRLRDIGGLIVIDFIDMGPAKNQRDVENRLRDALRLDRARIQIGKISRFGLLEMSRQRLAASLTGSHMTACKQCHGTGMTRSISSISMSILHKIQEQIVKTPHTNFELQLPTSVATYMINEERGFIAQLEAKIQGSIIIIPNPYLTIPEYQIKTGRQDSRATSYKLKKPKNEAASTTHKTNQTSQQAPQEPMISQNLLSNLRPAPRSKGWLGRLLQWLNGESKPKTTSNRTKPSNRTRSGQSSQRNRKPQAKRSTQSSTRSRQNREGQGQNRQGRQGRPPQKRQSRHSQTQTRSTEGASSRQRSSTSSRRGETQEK